VRIAAGILLLALTGVAGADVVADRHPVKPLSWALYFSGLGGSANDVGIVGLGPSAEVALGFDRTQLFVEGGAYYASAGTPPENMAGFLVRGGAGARWIARSFEMDDEGAVEMVLDGVVGAEKFWWENGENLLRPEFAAGVGLQVRKYAHPAFAVRFTIRIYFAPSDDQIHVPMAAAARCAGDCAPERHTSGGIMFAIGGGL
jgi:hypothetical protein